MTDKEFRMLNRRDLIEIIYQLQHEHVSTQKEIENLERIIHQNLIPDETEVNLQVLADQYEQTMSKVSLELKGTLVYLQDFLNQCYAELLLAAKASTLEECVSQIENTALAIGKMAGSVNQETDA